VVVWRVSCDESTGQAILKKESIHSHVDNLPCSRCPHKLSKSQQRRFSSLVQHDCAAMGKDLAVFMKQKLHMKISPWTAQQERKQLRY